MDKALYDGKETASDTVHRKQQISDASVSLMKSFYVFSLRKQLCDCDFENHIQFQVPKKGSVQL